ncbi:MAG: hypothetical protein ACTSX4_13405 [Candidatus Helarchaeota archaeon]
MLNITALAGLAGGNPIVPIALVGGLGLGGFLLLKKLNPLNKIKGAFQKMKKKREERQQKRKERREAKRQRRKERREKRKAAVKNFFGKIFGKSRFARNKSGQRVASKRA